MSGQDKKTYIVEWTLTVLALVIVLFVSPVNLFWADLHAPWYSPYLMWLLAILLSWLLQRHLTNRGL